jgi:uncharacterized secreted protein with C-terminal beta-propeller domain
MARRATTPRRSMLLVAVAGAVALAGCTSSTRPDTAAGTTPRPSAAVIHAPVATPNLQLVSALEPFDACDQLLGWVKDAAIERVGPYGLYDRMRGDGLFDDSGEQRRVPTAGVPASSPPTTASAPTKGVTEGGDTSGRSTDTTASNGSTTPDHSETNVQEQGVDEPDTIKTDGKRILAMTGNRLVIVNVEGTAPQTLGSLTLPGTGTSQLLAVGNHVLAINTNPGNDLEPASSRAIEDPYLTARPSTLLSIVDVGDAANPKILNTVRVDGAFVSARMVDGKARVVTSSTPVDLPFVLPSSNAAAAQDAATKANTAIIQDSKIEDWLPVVHISNGSTPIDRPLLDCAKVSHPKTFSGFGTLAVLSVDVNANEVNPAEAIGILADGQTVYASKANLYVATPAYLDPPRPATSGTSPSTVAPAAVPLRNATSIHKFDISAAGPAVYRASGDVEGSLLSQFSMSEDDGLLRVATTTNTTGCTRCSTTESFVRVLQETDGELKQIGQIGDMGHGEQVKAVRFVGKQGYVVTFRQTDPLYTLDLSVPTSPRVVGALQLLGYSAYLHPAGDNLLIGIGQDATPNGRALGTKVALYDMADLANPRELQQYVLWNTTSEVEQDFHAFTYWGPTKLAVIPVDGAYVGYVGGNCPDPGPTGGVCAPQTYIPPFTGAIGLTIDRNGIGELGRIVNPGTTSGPFPDCQRTGRCVPAPCPPDARCSGVVPTGDFGSRIERSVVIGDRLFTFSASGLKASELSTLHETWWLPFA